jgi:hypothetical protein
VESRAPKQLFGAFVYLPRITDAPSPRKFLQLRFAFAGRAVILVEITWQPAQQEVGQAIVRN